jgi:hypothetical protein
MISHYLTEIYQQLMLNESASIPDDVKQAMINNMDDFNKRFHLMILQDAAKLMSDEPMTQVDMQKITNATLEGACKHALRVYSNIDAATKRIFDEYIKNLKDGTKNVSWWGSSSTVGSYMEYCTRFGKEPVIAREYVKLILQSDNIQMFKEIQKWDAAAHIVNTYLNRAEKFDEHLEALIKKEASASGYTDADTRDMLGTYYLYYGNVLQKPCEWIDAMICSAPDDDVAIKIFNRISWARNRVALKDQKHIYNIDNFKRLICN